MRKIRQIPRKQAMYLLSSTEWIQDILSYSQSSNEIMLVTPNADFILPQGIAGKLSRLSIQTSAYKVAQEIIETLEGDYDDMDDIGKI